MIVCLGQRQSARLGGKDTNGCGRGRILKAKVLEKKEKKKRTGPCKLLRRVSALRLWSRQFKDGWNKKSILQERSEARLMIVPASKVQTTAYKNEAPWCTQKRWRSCPVPRWPQVHDEGGLAAHTDEIEGTHPWLSELAPRRAASRIVDRTTQGTICQNVQYRRSMGGVSVDKRCGGLGVCGG